MQSQHDNLSRRELEAQGNKSSPPASNTLSYARPYPGRRYRFKHVAAMVFAAFAMLLGVLSMFNALGRMASSAAEPTTRDEQRCREDAIRYSACSALLIGSAIWYGRVGFRGEPVDVDRERVG